MPSLPKETAGILDNVRESGALADLVASNLTPGAGLRRRQAEDPRDLRREGARARGRPHGPAPARAPPRPEGGLDDGGRRREKPARGDPPPADEDRSKRSSAKGATTTRSRSSASGCASRSSRDDALKIAKKQLARLAGMQQQSAEFNVTRTYLEWLADLPVDQVHAPTSSTSRTCAAASTRTTSASRR